MVQGWPLGSTVTVTGCTGISLGAKGTLSSSWYGVTAAYGFPNKGKLIKLEVGKIYEIKGWIGSVYSDGCIRVLGPTRSGPKTLIRVKHWDKVFNEWDHNEWIAEELYENMIREVSKLEALVLFGAVVK